MFMGCLCAAFMNTDFQEYVMCLSILSSIILLTIYELYKSCSMYVLFLTLYILQYSKFLHLVTSGGHRLRFVDIKTRELVQYYQDTIC
jgi:hypothetical protein